MVPHIRREWWLILSLSLFLCSCREKAAPSASQTTQPTPPPVSNTAIHSPAPSSTPMPLPTTATPEQIGSVLRIRVAFGGLPPRDSIAVLLHRDEIPDKSLVEGNVRFVLAPLMGWSAPQLRSAQARFIVYRNKVDQRGEAVTTPFNARLVQFDEKTGLGLLTYKDDFEYSLDVGFHIQRKDQADSDFMLLRTARDADTSLPSPPSTPPPQEMARSTRPSNGRGTARASTPYTQMEQRARLELMRAMEQQRERARSLPFAVDVGAYRGSKENGNKLELPPLRPQTIADSVLIGVNAPDFLAGFVSTSSDGAPPVVTSLDQFIVSIQPSIITAASVTFRNEGFGDRFGSQGYRMMVMLEPAKESDAPKRVWLYKRELTAPDEKAIPQPDAAGVFHAISEDKQELAGGYAGAGTWSILLEPPGLNQQQVFLMQLSKPWPFGDAQQPQVFSRPFIFKVERNAGGLYPSVIGLPAGSNAAGTDAALKSDATAAKFPLEAPAKSVHMVAGGRGALIEFDKAPFWKLFWFEKNQWLPLPGNVTNASVTGNLTTLFILDRDSRELRKFKLPGMDDAGLVKLPPGDYLTILAGCNSEHAPIHVLAADDALALDPATLERRDFIRKPADNSRSFAESEGKRFNYSVTGDGLGFCRFGYYEHRFFHYNSEARGVEFSYLGVGGPGEQMAGVSGGFTLDNGLQSADAAGGERFSIKPSYASQPPRRTAFAALAENAPVIFSLFQPDKQEVPPKPTRLGCSSFFDSTPFAELDVPEMAGIDATQGETKRLAWAFFDPYSRQLATLDATRKMWVVRKLSLGDEKRDQPVLLNWPDTTVPRGGKFQFRPELAGGKEFTAEVYNKPDLAVVDKTAGTVEFTSNPNDFESLRLLWLRVPAKTGGELSYPILVHTSGSELPFAAPLSIKSDGLNSRGADLPSLGQSNSQFLPLTATLHQFSDPIREIGGATAGCAVLITESNHVDFFSLQTRKVVGSITGPPGAWYYTGAGALFEYDPGKRTLARISVPDGRREQTLPFPPNVKLCAIGVGTERGSPLTLAVNVTQDKSWLRFSDLMITTTTFQTVFGVLDSLTFKAGSRPQPVYLSQLLGKKNADNFIGFVGTYDAKPALLPASHSGSMVNLPRAFLALGPSYAVAYPCDRPLAGLDIHTSDSSRAGGSISGLMAFSNSGDAFKGEAMVSQTSGVWQDFGPTPCGRYQLRRVEVGSRQNCLEIRLAENGQPLMRVARLAFMDEEQFFGRFKRHIIMLGDNGPLGILSASGKALQLVDLDIPTVAKALVPEEFHVVSQPVPFVMEGRTIQYQVQVNNPKAVQSVQLQRAVPGASFTPQGLLSYRAPATISEPTRTIISIEIKGKNGRTVLHEFPLYILPFARPGTNSKVGEI